jgi:hypothetical protein
MEEMQLKTTVRFHLTPVRMATIKNTTNIGEDARGKRDPIHSCWECKLVESLWNVVWKFLKKTKNRTDI